MCGIVGAIAERNVSGILLEGLKRLEYRGYDSAGIALLQQNTNRIDNVRTVGKVQKLIDAAGKNIRENASQPDTTGPVGTGLGGAPGVLPPL